MPTVQITMNVASSFYFTALRSIIIDGSNNVVTTIINDNAVPNCALLNKRDSAIGIVPKMLVLHQTDYHFQVRIQLIPREFSCGMPALISFSICAFL